MSTLNNKAKLFGAIGLFLLLIVTSISLYVMFKDLSPEKIFSLNKKAVVFITTYNLLGEPTGYGSGFILAANGVVATNLHLVKDAASISIKTTDDRILTPIGVLHIDDKNDIALIKIKVKENVEYFKVKTGDPQKLEVGEKIYALGNPKGIESTFSEGIVSGIREIKSGVKLIQITAPISPGSSGGPLINRKGEVVGITTFLVEQGQNLNFAYPINVIETEIDVNKIIYTFPDLKANWKLVSGGHHREETIDVVDEYYYDPESIVNLEANIKGVWGKSLWSIKSINSSLVNIGRTGFIFFEIDCSTKKGRRKVWFSINDKKEIEVDTDFSNKNTWESWKTQSEVDKISTIVCQPQK